MFAQGNFHDSKVKNKAGHGWSAEQVASTERLFKKAAYTSHPEVYEAAMCEMATYCPSARTYCESFPKESWSQAFMPCATFDCLTDNAAGI